MSKIEINPEVAAKYSCNLVNPKFDCLGNSYNLATITLEQVDELVAKGNKAFELKKVATESKEAKPKA